MNYLEKLIAIIVAIVIIFLVPASYFLVKKDHVIQINVENLTENLTERAAVQGYITKEMYEGYLKELAYTKKLYDIELVHTKAAFEPEYRMRTIGEILDENEDLWEGVNDYHADPVSTEIPAISDPVATGPLNTETNASVLASAVNTQAPVSHIHSDACYHGHRHTASGCVQGLSYYTGQVVPVYHIQNNNSFELGRYVNYREIYCSNCGNRIASVSSATTSNNVPFTGFVRLAQLYLAPDNQIKWAPEIETGQFLISPTDPGGWYHFKETVYAGGYPMYFDEYRQERGNWYMDYIVTFNIISDDGTAVRKGPLYSLGYQDAYSCPYCLQSNRLSKTLVDGYSCGMTQDATPDCSAMIASVEPTHPVQTVATNDPIISTAKITYQDGSIQTKAGTTTFSTTNVGQNRMAILTFTYTVEGTVYTKTCNVTVTVVPRSKICTSGHTYNLNNDGTDAGCPYCRGWLRSLSVFVPSSGNLTIYRNPADTLESEGVGLLAVYMDGHKEYVYNGYTDNLDPDYVGNQTVTIGYKGLTTSLPVTVLRNKKKCDVCGLFYELQPDDQDMGCPYCKAKVPVFTGNVMKYEAGAYQEEIITELYENSGIYYFRRGDTISVKVRSNDKLELLSFITGVLRLRVQAESADTVRDEATK